MRSRISAKRRKQQFSCKNSSGLKFAKNFDELHNFRAFQSCLQYFVYTSVDMYLEHLLAIERTETSDFLPIYNCYLHIHSSQLIISLNIPISSENLRNFGKLSHLCVENFIKNLWTARLSRTVRHDPVQSKILAITARPSQLFQS